MIDLARSAGSFHSPARRLLAGWASARVTFWMFLGMVVATAATPLAVQRGLVGAIGAFLVQQVFGG